MPNPSDFANQDDFMKACVPMRVGEGDTNEQAVGACMGMWNSAQRGASKSVMMCADLCRLCVQSCIECMRMCQASAYANTQAAKDCIDACHHCIAVCQYCAVVCEEGNLSEIEKACADCMVACDACMKACQVCAEKCPDCKDACQQCYDACARCSNECSKTMGEDMGGEMDMSVPMKADRFGGKPRDKLKESDFVFPDERAFPVMTTQDVHDAVSSWGRYRGGKSFDEFKRRLTTLAKRKGLEGALPQEWKDNVSVKMIFNAAVKVAGNWKLKVKAVPFDGKDSDGQWFDPNTDIMEKAFQTPIGVYQHGIKAGAKGLQEKVIIVGETVPGTLKKMSDGWYLDMELDPTKAEAKRIMDAAWKGNVAVSSGSVSHLARLEVGGRIMQYQKDKPGRIATWPLAEVSLWELGGGNVKPASRFAVAMPAMKAIYREAGIAFPDVAANDTNGVFSYTEQVVKRARVNTAKDEAEKILKRIKEKIS